jgi:hypothetical protein
MGSRFPTEASMDDRSVMLETDCRMPGCSALARLGNVVSALSRCHGGPIEGWPGEVNEDRGARTAASRGSPGRPQVACSPAR